MGSTLLKQTPKNVKIAIALIIALYIIKHGTRTILLRLKAAKYREIVNLIHAKRDRHIEEFFKSRAIPLGSGLKERILGCNSLSALQNAVKKGQFTYEEIFLTFAERACAEGKNCNLIADINLNEGKTLF